jgi:hypothetical protein
MGWITTKAGAGLLLQFLRNRRKAILSATLLDFSANIGTIMQSLLLAQMLAAFSGFKSMRAARLGWAITDEYVLCGVFVAVLVIKLLLDYVRLRLRGNLSEDFAAWLRLETMRQFTSTGGARGRLRLSSDMTSAQRLLGRGVLQFGADLSLILLGLAFLAWLHLGVASVGLVIIIIGGFVLRYLNQFVKQVEKDRRLQKTRLLHLIDKMPRVASDTDTDDWQHLQKNFARKTEAIRRCGGAYHRHAAWSEALPVFWSQLLLLGVLLAGWGLGMTADTLFLTVLILMSWRNPLSRLLKADLIWRKGLLSLEKLQSEEIEKIAVEKKLKKFSNNFQRERCLFI